MSRILPLLAVLVAAGGHGNYPPSELSWVTFGSGIAVNAQTGEVRVPKGVALDRASRQFWTMVASVAATRDRFGEAAGCGR